MKTVAIIGSGLAGLGCAHFLHRHFDVTVFEQDGHTGGHANTVLVREPGTGRELPIDTGFMVFNRVTYPLLVRLFEFLRVPVKPTDMSFSVRDHESGLEWCGSSLNHLFAQRKNLLNRRFIRMLTEVNRFNREAVRTLDDPILRQLTLRAYVQHRGHSDDFVNLYLVPMSSAVWSTAPEQMMEFPAEVLIRFFHNHGFLGLNTQHQWWTVDGGSREYVRRLTAPWRDRVVNSRGVTGVRRARGAVIVTTADGTVREFDRVIVATHADQARQLLADPTDEESRLLGAFGYQANVATLHTDQSVLPRAPLARASWNYELVRGPDGRFRPATHYWMNRLQGVSDRESYFVSINRPEDIAPGCVIRRIPYAHPLFNLAATRAQVWLPELNRSARGGTETYFAGSYFRHGFHEDALFSAAQLSELLLECDPWADGPASGSGEPAPSPAGGAR